MDIDSLTVPAKELYLDYLLGFVTENKISKFESVVKLRTKKLTIILENIFQPHNASAVLRSCDCFGIHDVHIIESKYPFNINPDVVMGSTKWLNLHKYSNPGTAVIDCITELKSKGYSIVATTPHENDLNIEDLPVDGKLAIIFGTELSGLSDAVLENADYFMKIPMVGFTESLNVSVSAAISLFYLTNKMRNSTTDWQLTHEEMLNIKIQWAKRVLKSPELLEKKYFEDFPDDAINKK